MVTLLLIVQLSFIESSLIMTELRAIHFLYRDKRGTKKNNNNSIFTMEICNIPSIVSKL